MFNLNETNKYNFFTQVVNTRKGVESLCEIFRTYHINPLNSKAYIFTNKSRHLLKMLHREHGGYVVYYKRLEQGRLTKTFFKQTEHAFMSLSWDGMLTMNKKSLVTYFKLEECRLRILL